MRVLVISLVILAGAAAAGLYPALGASLFLPSTGGYAVYYHGGLGYAFPSGWDTELGIGYASWSHEGQDYSIMPLMGSGTYHFLPRESIMDLYTGLGLGYAWRHMGNAGDLNSPCGQVFAGTSLALGNVFGIGISGGYLADDLGHLDQGGFGLGFSLGFGIPF